MYDNVLVLSTACTTVVAGGCIRPMLVYVEIVPWGSLM